MQIVYAADGSEQDRASAHLLASLPFTPDTTMVLLTVATPDHGTPQERWGVLHGLQDILKPSGVRLDLQVRWGDRDEQILRAAEELSADLIVLNDYGLPHGEPFTHGVRCEEVARRTQRPVLLLRPWCDGTLPQAVVCLSSGADVDDTVRFLALLPLPPGCRVHLVSAVFIGDTAPASVPNARSPIDSGGRRAAETRASVYAALLKQRGVRQVTTELRPIDTVTELLSLNAEADLLVIGPQGRAFMERTTPDSPSCHSGRGAKALRRLQSGKSSRRRRVVSRRQSQMEENAAAVALAEVELLYASTRLGVAFFDRELRFVRVNRVMADLNGVSAAWTEGRTLSEALGPELANLLEPLFRQVLESGEPLLDCESTGSTAARAGQLRSWRSCYRPVRDTRSGRILGLSAIVEEITEPEEARDVLRASDEWFRLLVDAIEDYAFFTLDPEGKVVSWNYGAERVLGYAASDILGRSVSGVYTADARAARAMEAELDAAARTGRSRSEGWRVRKDGQLILVQTVTTPLRDPAGGLRGFLNVARNITEQENFFQTVSRLESSVRQGEVLLDAANRVALDILSNRTGREALRHIAQAACSLTGARGAAIGMAPVAGAAGVGDIAAFVSVGEIDIGLETDANQSLIHDGGAFLEVPIQRQDTVIGGAYLIGKPDGFTPADHEAVRTLASYAAVVIHHLHQEERLRTLFKGVLTAQEEERRAVAYELHDGLVQYIMAAHGYLQAAAAAREQGRSDLAVTQEGEGMRLLQYAVTESRRLVNGLRTLALDDLGLAGAVEQLLAEEKARAEWQDADFVHNIASRRFDPALETAVYRVAQEGLANARKHAAAPRVRVLLLAEEDRTSGTRHLKLEVRDWGRGFDPAVTVSSGQSFGLTSIAERVLLTGGRHELHSTPGQGTVVRAVFPLPCTDSLPHEEKW